MKTLEKKKKNNHFIAKFKPMDAEYTRVCVGMNRIFVGESPLISHQIKIE